MHNPLVIHAQTSRESMHNPFGDIYTKIEGITEINIWFFISYHSNQIESRNEEKNEYTFL